MIFRIRLLFSALALFTSSAIFRVFAQPLAAHAGSNVSVCINDSVQIGGSPAATGGTTPYTYSWTPVTGLDNPAAANPNAFPASATPYTLTVTDGAGNTSSSVVSVALLPLPTVVAGPDQTIMGGTSTQLQASGAVNYFWSPDTSLSSQSSASPTADPGSSITYCVAGADNNGCVNFDCTELEVIPSDTVIIYNSFTPNGDGVNDFLYIGNIQQFPNNKTEVFNRNGKLVFVQSPYGNNWNGKVDGANLPCATYYVVFNKGDGKGKAQGAVTIIR